MVMQAPAAADAVVDGPPEPAPLVALELTPKQQAFVELALSGQYRYLALGGAIRGTKTFTMLIVFVVLMRLYPRSRWAIVRSDLPTLRRNTVPSIEKLRATMGGWLGELNHSTWTYTAANGSQLLLFPESIQQDPDLDRWKGLEVNGFGLEEANELARKSFHKGIERAGAWVIPPDPAHPGQRARQPAPLILATFNPSDEWTDEVFHEPYELGTLAAPYSFTPLTIRDNPHLSPDYLASLEELRQASPEDYERFVLGKRGAVTQPNQLIPADWLVKARHIPHTPGTRREAVDVARYGDDETVFARLDGNALVELEAHAKWSTRETADRAAIRLAEHGISADCYAVDTVGLGGGVADNLHAAGYTAVRSFEGGAKPVPRLDARGRPSQWKFRNLRSQAWWEFREKLRTEQFRLSITHPKLTKDLTAPRYSMDSDRVIEVESKDSIKKRLGRSPDYGDAVVMAAFDWPPAVRRAPQYTSSSHITPR